MKGNSLNTILFPKEKGAINKNSEFTFYVDPLDGTNNFVLGIPNFSISIGLFCNDVIIAGVIYTPIINHTYYALKGQGAFFYDKKLAVNKDVGILKATIAFICSYNTNFSEEGRICNALYSKDIKRFVVNWSPTYDFGMLASGRIEGIININSELYDFAAGKLIAREAGAKITDFQGNLETEDKNKLFLISNGSEVHDLLVNVMKSQNYE